MTVYTHFHVSCGEVDLLAGDVTQCDRCGRVLYRACLAISLSHPDPSGGVNTVNAHRALGRLRLPEDAEGADDGITICEDCTSTQSIP